MPWPVKDRARAFAPVEPYRAVRRPWLGRMTDVLLVTLAAVSIVTGLAVCTVLR